MKFKVGDRVKGIRKCDCNANIIGQLGEVIEVCDAFCQFPYAVKFDNNIGGWGDDDSSWWCSEKSLELVEDKKVFSKKDLRNGDFVELNDGSVGVVIHELNRIVYQDGMYDDLDKLRDDMSFSFNPTPIKVYRPRGRGIGACFNRYKDGELVYDRERDTICEMTVAEIEKEIGYQIKVVKE